MYQINNLWEIERGCITLLFFLNNVTTWSDNECPKDKIMLIMVQMKLSNKSVLSKQKTKYMISNH